MLNWLQRKKRSDSERPMAEAPAVPAPTTPDRVAWQQRLDTAHGDEAALLELARSAPLLDVKLAAVEALIGEAALKQAEREFRSHDRKVHQLARQRLASAVAKRETRAKADAAIAAAQALLGTTPIAVNRLAELHRDWSALAADLLEASQREAFAELRERLDAALHAQDEAQRMAQWSQPASQALADLEHACAAGDVARIESGISMVRTRLDACPPGALASELAQALRTGLDAARQALNSVTEAASAAPPPAPEPPPHPVAVPAGPKHSVGVPGVEDLLQQAETALAEGISSNLNRHLQAIDGLLARHHGGTLPARARARLQALHAERQRLTGWQRWGGAVAREGLVDEAEALARATAAAQAEPPQGKLNLHAHGEAIRKLRARWKELDRSGAAAGQALWLRFDAALTLAHAPVAAQQEALKAARAENLSAREALLSKLELAAAVEGQAPRAALQALHDFQVAWRKLGPIEHTVPAASVDGLQARVAAATGRIEAPLAEARAAAQREREALVERAEALAAQEERDAPAQLRQLQSDWSQHARALPLPRAVEAALWARFRRASDAVFARVSAAEQAREAQAAAGIAARESLLQRLDALAQDASLAAADLARAIAQVEREWRDLYTPLPRAVAEGLEARFRGARQAAAQAAELRQRVAWQTQCDALAERLALCELREAGDADVDALGQRWQAVSAAPAVWQRVLDGRWSGAAPKPGEDAADAETLLLRLEDALGITPAAAQAQARRDLKLRALKEALEGRAAMQATSEPRRNAEWLAALLARRDLAAEQRRRWPALIDAIRGAPQKFDAG